MAKIPKDLLDAINSNPPPKPDEDRLNAIRSLASDAWEKERVVEELEERVKALKAEVRSIYEEKLVAMMDEVGIDKIGVPARGNAPAFDLTVKTEYSANIAAGWDPQRRREAFDWLEKNGHGDIIKTELSVLFPREEREVAVDAAKKLEEEYGVAVKTLEWVEPPTMKSWFKEMYKKNKPLPPLDVIGGRVHRVADPKLRKE